MWIDIFPLLMFRGNQGSLGAVNFITRSSEAVLVYGLVFADGHWGVRLILQTLHNSHSTRLHH